MNDIQNVLLEKLNVPKSNVKPSKSSDKFSKLMDKVQAKDAPQSSEPAEPTRKEEVDVESMQQMAAMQAVQNGMIPQMFVNQEAELNFSLISAESPCEAVDVAGVPQMVNPDSAEQNSGISELAEITAAGENSQTGNLQNADAVMPMSANAQNAGTKFQTGTQQPEKEQQLEVQDGWAGEEKPLFRNLDLAPVKVSEAAVAAKPSQSIAGQVMDGVQKGLAAGDRKIEVQLTPQNLGKIRIEMTQHQDGSLSITLHVEHNEVRAMLERGLPEMQQMLKDTTQQDVQIQVPQEQENQNLFYDQQQEQNRENQQQNQQEQKKSEHREDFLNQLRLGLIPQVAS